jgi:hypothetical protein
MNSQSIGKDDGEQKERQGRREKEDTFPQETQRTVGTASHTGRGRVSILEPRSRRVRESI